MARGMTVLVSLVVACSGSDRLSDLRMHAATLVSLNRPALDGLVARVIVLKRRLQGNASGWEMMLRNTEAANDELGLQPFTQSQPPGPEWRASPASLLGMGPYVLMRAQQLAEQGKLDELEFLVEDARRRYREGIADVDRRLAQVEQWIASSVNSSR